MDQFTQKILERAEQRSKTLGITSTAKFPLSDFNQDCKSSQGSCSVKKSTPPSSSRTTPSPTKKSTSFKTDSTISKSSTRIVKNVTERQLSTESKENVDVGIEINITTGPNVQVQVEVEEQEIDSDGNVVKHNDDESTAMIRDSSRNRLQRLGALYSETENLSSPIHRTEGRFHEGMELREPTPQPKSRFGKLAQLASSINSWEDDTSHSDQKIVSKDATGPPKPKRLSTPKKTGATPKKMNAPKPPSQLSQTNKQEGAPTKSISNSPQKTIVKENENKKDSKNLKWDKKVMDALESQGFQRRESSTSKLTYNYKNTEETRDRNDDIPLKDSIKSIEVTSRKVPSVIPGSEITKKDVTKKVEVSRGLVSGRAALFEGSSIASSGLTGRSQKDPAEMSLKERMALFEKNKGTALIPKAPLGISASVKQIMGDTKTSQAPVHPIQLSSPTQAPPVTHKVGAYNKSVVAESKAAGTGIRSTVAALMASGTTISESQISQDVRKQRQQEMDIVLNRFNQPKTAPEIKTNQEIQQKKKVVAPLAPPPAPPLPPTNYKQSQNQQHHIEATCLINNNKRRSDEKRDSAEVRCALDDVKRIRVNPPRDGHLYPVLSDLETTESDQDNYTTATVSCTDSKDDVERRFHQADDSYDDDERQQNEEDDSYMDSEDADTSGGICNGSLGREIMNAVKRNESPIKQQLHQQQQQYYSPKKTAQRQCPDSSTGSEVSDALGDIDEYLNDMDEDDEDEEEEEEVVTPQKKGTISSDSFSYAKPTKQVRYQTINEDGDEVILRPQNSKFRSPVKSELIVSPSKTNDDLVTLVHTVSFYRRQQTASINQSGGGGGGGGSASPTRKQQQQRPLSCKMEYTKTHNDDNDDDCDDDDEYDSSDNNDKKIDNKLLVQEKVKKLLDEVCKQQQIISQTSQALNLCAATIEFSGSTESVEGERHLLVANHRRQAALDEVQRLRIEGTIRPQGSPQERGRLTIKDIILPLKQDYIKKLASDQITGHHLVCILKYNENILATKTVPTLPGLVSVKFPDILQLTNVYADFKVTLEIYGMTAQREILPHEVKYHIQLNKKNLKILTPKGKKCDSRLIMPPVQSPAGPQAVRTPALSHYGFVIFSLREIQRKSWSLNQSSGVSPLDGTVHMKVNCELNVSVDYRGFLTMFEDVSGFGAWHRRWCRLHGHVLSYWKYPDDEKKKPPMGSIDLYNCYTQKVTLAPRDVCARLNTILLESRRDSQKDDVESLILVKHGKYTVVRYLLSADTKEDREEWCHYLNKSLALLRAWGPPE